VMLNEATQSDMLEFKHFVDTIDPTTLESKSQAGQDLFVIAMLQGKRQGTFLEIGAGKLNVGSNTFLLEKEFGFSGTSIDIIDAHSLQSWQKEVNQWWSWFYADIRDESWPTQVDSIDDLPSHIQKECREVHNYDAHLPAKFDWSTDRPLTKFLNQDATKLDYSFLDPVIDYLQIDIDPPGNNLLVLEKVLTKSKFSVVTFEHDFWRSTEESNHVREKSRSILAEYGYRMVANDVTIEPHKGSGSDEPLFFEDWYAHPDLVEPRLIDGYSCITQHLIPKYYFDILFCNTNPTAPCQ